MKKFFWTAALGVLTAAIAAPGRAVEMDSAAKSHFESLMREFTTSWNAHDAAKMAATFGENGDLINPFDRAAKGRAEIQKLFTEEQGGPMKESAYKIESSTFHEINKNAGIGDWTGVVTGIRGPDGKVQPPFKHHVTAFMVKVADKWECAAVRAYVFAATPPPPPAAAPKRK